MKRISTHILDLMRGKPAAGVAVSLMRREAGEWKLLTSAHTDADGRCPQLLPGDELPAGEFRIVFHTAEYFGAMKIATLYPVIEITFEVREGESHFHIPLLLNANGYTTYRGS
jgi:5-hydroxyisourate hydrolase